MSVVPRNGKIAVIGAGISGLSYAYFLRKLRPDVHVTVFDKAVEPGGWIKTLNLRDNGDIVHLEKGPRTLRGVSDGTMLIVDILRQLKLEHEVEVMEASSSANRKWLLDGSNKLVQVPNSIALFAKFLMSDVTDGALKGALSEPFRRGTTPNGDEPIESFVTRRFGSPQLANNIISAVMHGIYSGDVAKLSVKSTMPSLIKLEENHGSIVKAAIASMFSKKQPVELSSYLQEYENLISPTADFTSMKRRLKAFPILRLNSGLQTFPKALAEHLNQDDGVTLCLNTDVSTMNLKNCTITTYGQNSESELHFDQIRFDAGFKALQRCIRINDETALKAINDIRYSTIFLANVYIKNRKLIPKHLEGFGFLVPKRNKNPQSLLGVIYDSCTESDAQNFFDGSSKGLVPYTKLTLMMGGHFFETRGIPSSKGNLRAVKSVLKEILGIEDDFKVVIRDEAAENSKEICLGDSDMLISYNLHRDCIPFYNVGFSDNVLKVVNWVDHESLGKVTLGGPNMGKLGIPDCVVSELEAALSAK